MTIIADRAETPVETPTPTATHTIATLDHGGHSEFTWDANNREEVAAAQAHFGELRRKGFLTYRVDGDRREVIRDFDPSAERIIATPQLQGG